MQSSVQEIGRMAREWKDRVRNLSTVGCCGAGVGQRSKGAVGGKGEGTFGVCV